MAALEARDKELAARESVREARVMEAEKGAIEASSVQQAQPEPAAGQNVMRESGPVAQEQSMVVEPAELATVPAEEIVVAAAPSAEPASALLPGQFGERPAGCKPSSTRIP